MSREIGIMLDGATLEEVADFATNDSIEGFTSNPSLMKAAGVEKYEVFAREAIELAGLKSFSFEVVSDDSDAMIREAKIISSWGENVFVKIPVTDSAGKPTVEVIKACRSEGIKVNVTALFSRTQVDSVVTELAGGPEAFISVFAGRIADTGVDPSPEVEYAVRACDDAPGVRVIWASTREVFNIYQAQSVGCHVITVPSSLFRKYVENRAKSLEDYSLETVQMFVNDARSAGLSI
jgi:transaldolase